MKVLIAIDDSEYSRWAVTATTMRSFTQRVQFKLLHVIEPFDPIEPSAVTPSHEWAAFVQRVRKQRHDDAHRVLLSATETLRKRFPQAEILSHTVEGFLPAASIASTAEEWPADLIVVGCRGTRGLKRVMLGSVSHTVVQQSTCSVEVVKQSPSLIGDTAASTSRNILVAVDESDCSMAALEMFKRQNWAEANIKLITVAKPTFELFGIELDGFLKDAIDNEEKHNRETKADWLEAKAQDIGKQYKPGQVTFEVLTGDAREMILQTSFNWPAQLIVLGSRERRMTKMLLGSVSEAILLSAHCSVQIVKAS